MMGDYKARPPKRPRLAGGNYPPRETMDTIPASPVVFLSGVQDMVTSEDIVADLSSFGPISYTVVLSKRRQALVEFENVQSAETLVNFTKNNPVFVGGKPVQAAFSTSQKLERQYGEPRNEERPNNVLLYTIVNPLYPITVDVLNTISSTHGKVNRIVIFRKQGVQAMVEFETVEMAQRAKQNLNGADIYSGCCTLKLEYARPTRLNVIRNDGDSWDYTNPSLGAPEPQAPRTAPLLADPPYAANKPYDGYGDGGQADSFDLYGRATGPPPPQGQRDPYADQRGYPPPPPDRYRNDRYQEAYPPGPPGRQQGGRNGPRGDHDGYGSRGPMGFGGPGYDERQPPSNAMLQQNAVVMVYGLNPTKVNCTHLFNLFCIYGNVVRIKFLRSKEGAAMIQMGEPGAAERVCNLLNGANMFGHKLNLSFSKQAFLQDVPNPYDLPDGTKSFVDFMGNRNNRYTTPDAAAKNRIHPPSKTLYFWNAPPKITEDQVVEVFEGMECKLPIKVKIFPSKTERSSTGLVEFENKTEAVEAVCLANHKEMSNPAGKFPFVFKLCFSENPIITKRMAPQE
jgi:heterogeneous nuclear ribonucleoprotein L